MSGQQLQSTIQDGDQMYLCKITSEGIITINEQDPQIQTLLQEFVDVFPDKLLAELPPKRDINHHITLEPESQPPW